MIRCSRCVLPQTYPNISFDENGVCNYCKTHKDFTPLGERMLIDRFRKAKKKGRIYDALVPLSGGKDSTYILYLTQKRYNLNVLAYTLIMDF